MTKEQYKNLKNGDKVKYTGEKYINSDLTPNKIYTVEFKADTMQGIRSSIFLVEAMYGNDHNHFECIPPNSVRFIKELKNESRR